MRRTLLTLAAAALAAASGLLLAPDGWPTGSGTLEVEVGGQQVRRTVEVGDTEPTEFRDSGVTVELPSGVPVDAALEVLVRVDEGPVREPAVTLVLPGGDTETVPVLSSSADEARALRRPPADAGITVALLAAVIVLWVSEVVPLHVTALAIPVVLATTGTQTASDALAPFFDPIIVLFFGGFLMARALAGTGLDRLAASVVVARAGTSPARLLAAMIVASAFASMWMSNTAAVTVLLPVALAVTGPLDAPGYQRTVVLGIAYAATIGGVGSAIGTPANPLAIDFLDQFAGREITFVEWFLFGVPMLVLFLPIMGVYLWWRGDVRVDAERFVEARHVARRHQQQAGRLTGHQLQVLGVFGVVVLLWLTQGIHDVNTGIVALGGAVALMVLGRIETADLGRISWPTLLTFGGGLTLGTALVTSGSADWVVTRLGGVGGWPQWLAVGAVAAVALGVTTVASNTASAATLIPLAIPLAGLLDLDPVLLVVVVAVASSIDFALVIGTPPTMLAYGTGLFTVRDILRRGIVLDAVGLGLVVLVMPRIWELLGAL